MLGHVIMPRGYVMDYLFLGVDLNPDLETRDFLSHPRFLPTTLQKSDL